MSDNQSENSQQWSGTPLDDSTDEVFAAEMDVKQAQEEIWKAEEALEAATRAFVRAKGYLEFVKKFVKVRPTWKQILVPGVDVNISFLYTMCMQLGYSYALWNGKIYAAGRPGEQMMDTGMVEADIK